MKSPEQQLDTIKKPNIGEVDMSEQQLLEIVDCIDDPHYFMTTFMKVQHPILGSLPFQPYPFQTRIIDAFHKNRFSIILTARQCGKTTCAAGFLLWKAMFTPDTTILVAANKFVQAIEIMDRIKYAYENLPDHIRAGVIEYNKSTIKFDNGSRIVSRATTPDAGRGLSISLLYLDEFAFVMPNKAKDFWAAMTPVLSTGGSCIITSTPNNDEDQFSQIWKGAIDNLDEYGNERPGGVGVNNYFAVKVPWWEHPDRDEKWANTYREQLGEAKFRQEMECDFVSSDETLINPLTLVRLRAIQPIYYTGTVRWYKEPEPNKTYMAALDPSLGTGGDYAAIQVFQVPEMIQVAEWQHNNTAPRLGTVPPYMFVWLWFFIPSHGAGIINWLYCTQSYKGKWINKCFI